MMSRVLQLYSRITCRPSLLRINQAIAALGLRGTGFLNAESHDISGENWLLRKMAQHTQMPVVVDVGANVGDFAVEVRRMIPGSRLIAIEPHPQAFKHLAKAASTHSFEAINLACGRSSGRTTLFDYAATGDATQHASIYENVIRTVHQESPRPHEVELTTVDHILETRGIDRVDLLKIDAEGAELSILEGAAKSLAGSHISAVQFEYNQMHQVAGHSLSDFARILPGFRLYRLLPRAAFPLDGFYPMFRGLPLFQNILAVRDASWITF